MRVSFVALETVHHRETAANGRLHELARSLVDRGHDVTVHTSQWWDSTESERERDDITYRGVVVDRSARESFYLRLPYSLFRASPDVIHSIARPPGQAVAANVGSTVARAPLLVEWYGDETSDPGPWYGRALRGADTVVTPSRLIATAARELGVDGDDVQVVPNAIDMDLVRETDPDDDGGSIVYARRLDEDAHLESLLLALAELRQLDWSATVIGDGPAREDYERQARDLRIDDRVEFVGEYPREKRVATYRNAHVFVQTALECEFATELLWALACGCIGIVEYHARSSAHELVEGLDRGFRTTSEDELTQAIEEAATLEHRTVDEAFASFDRDSILERYLECYRDLRDDFGVV